MKATVHLTQSVKLGVTYHDAIRTELEASTDAGVTCVHPNGEQKLFFPMHMVAFITWTEDDE